MIIAKDQLQVSDREPREQLSIQRQEPIKIHFVRIVYSDNRIV